MAAVYAKKGHREMASMFADNIKQVQLGVHAMDLYPLKYAATGFLRIRAEGAAPHDFRTPPSPVQHTLGSRNMALL